VLEWLDAIDRATGAVLPRRAEWQQSLALAHDAGPWSASLQWQRVGKRVDAGSVLAAYDTVDLVASWRLTPGLQLQAKVLNAGDRDIEPLRDYQALGRQAWLVLRWTAWP
jgi:vitamin B12 transporter